MNSKTKTALAWGSIVFIVTLISLSQMALLVYLTTPSSPATLPPSVGTRIESFNKDFKIAFIVSNQNISSPLPELTNISTSKVYFSHTSPDSNNITILLNLYSPPANFTHAQVFLVLLLFTNPNETMMVETLQPNRLDVNHSLIVSSIMLSWLQVYNVQTQQTNIFMVLTFDLTTIFNLEN